MAEKYPLTIEQLRQTKRDLDEITERTGEIAGLMSACYGDNDQKTIRAQEGHAALQRLQRELGREQAAKA